MQPRWTMWVAAAALSLVGLGAQAQPAISGVEPQIAFYYGRDVPVPELQAFDWVVLDPASAGTFDPKQPSPTAWFARVDLAQQADAIRGSNWPGGVLDTVFAPLLAQGYQGFLLDGLDTLQRVAPDAGNAVVALVRALHDRAPQTKVLAGGTAWLDRLAPQLAGVVTPGLVRERSGDAGLRDVSEADRAARIAALRSIGTQYHLPAVALDYCPSYTRACLRDTANVARTAGVTAYATTPAVDVIGIGRLEVMPRRVLLVEPQEPGTSTNTLPSVLYLAMPLNYLGYRVEVADAYQPLPTVTPDRYAGVVTWFDANAPHPGTWAAWLRRVVGAGVRVAMFNQFGLRMDAAMAQTLSLEVVPGAPPEALSIVSRDPMIGFELQPHPDRRSAVGVKVSPNTPGARSLLRLSAGRYAYDAAAIMPWGGYVLQPSGVFRMPDVDQARWVIQPLAFLREALALPAMPIPDTTTENGRRLMTVHIDGDGFASRTEFPPGEFSGQALQREIFARYKVPTTVSIIEGEVAANGMYPKLTPQLEPIARSIFALPYVELASHTFSHPFNWLRTASPPEEAVTPTAGAADSFSLRIPNYRFNLDREVAGSIDYINTRLAPPDKRVKVLLWSGNGQVPPAAVQAANQAGVLSMNGGDTYITRSNPSWTAVAPLGVDKGGGLFQVFAPAQNENIYTNLWQGPYYGFRRAVETFELTDKPYRFKPIGIYYHMYSGTKLASLTALRQVYDWALAQPVMPVYASDYIRKVLDFRSVAVARDGDAWVVRGAGDLRTVRWSADGVPHLADARDVAGYQAGPGGTYIHLTSGAARFSIDSAPQALPYVREASGRLSNWRRAPDGRSLSVEVAGYVHPFIRFANAQGCRATVDGHDAGSALGAPSGDWRLDLGAGDPAKPVPKHVELHCSR